MRKRKQWEHLKVVICNSCNNFFHPENKLYEKIRVIENKLKNA
jgi:hypothetical protein